MSRLSFLTTIVLASASLAYAAPITYTISGIASGYFYPSFNTFSDLPLTFTLHADSTLPFVSEPSANIADGTITLGNQTFDYPPINPQGYFGIGVLLTNLSPYSAGPYRPCSVPSCSVLDLSQISGPIDAVLYLFNTDPNLGSYSLATDFGPESVMAVTNPEFRLPAEFLPFGTLTSFEDVTFEARVATPEPWSPTLVIIGLTVLLVMRQRYVRRA